MNEFLDVAIDSQSEGKFPGNVFPSMPFSPLKVPYRKRAIAKLMGSQTNFRNLDLSHQRGKFCIRKLIKRDKQLGFPIHLGKGSFMCLFFGLSMIPFLLSLLQYLFVQVVLNYPFFGKEIS